MTNSSHRPRALAAVLGAALLCVLSACGSSGGDSAGSSGASSSSKVDEAGLKEARADLAEYSKRPTEIPNKTPITAPIPTGKTITFLSAGTSTSNLEYAIIKEATDKLGWTLNSIANDGTPEKVKAAWTQILRTKPDGVIYAATDRATFNAELIQATKLGIKTVACCTTDPADADLSYVIGTPEQSAPVGKALAVWMIDKSDGKGSSVYVDLSVFKILKTVGDEYKSTVKTLCPACSTDTIDIPITALGKDVPDRIVSYLRAHPKTKYVILSVDGGLGAGLPAALKAANLGDVKVIGEGPDETTLQYIASGQQEATVTFPYYEQMFSLVDALARQFAGVPLETGLSIPNWIVTAKTLPDDTKIFPVVADVKEQYFKLWGLG